MNALMDILAPYVSALSGQGSALDPTSMMSSAPGGLLQLLAQSQDQGGGGGQGSANASGADPNANRWEQLAAQLAARQYGWGPHQFNAIDQIATAESGWNPHAVNPNGGAAGIPQALPSAHPGLVDKQWMNDPRAQIEWMLNYIHDRYGTPQHALSVRENQGWY